MSQAVNNRHLAKTLFTLTCCSIFLVLVAYSCSDGTQKVTDHATRELQGQDAESRVRSAIQPTAYTLKSLPAWATGEWSRNINLLDCNVSLYDCVNLTYAIPAYNVEARWVLSYSRGTPHYCCMRAMNQATSTIFEMSQEPASTSSIKSQTLSATPSKTNEETPATSQASSIDHSGYGRSQKAAFTFVTSSFKIDPSAVIPHMGVPLPANGDWSSDFRPQDQICRPDQGQCYVVTYVAVLSVETGDPIQETCRWVIFVPYSEDSPQLKEENDCANEFFLPH